MKTSQEEALLWLKAQINPCIIQGEAGTGKTYLMKLFEQQTKDEVLFTAPTNKAVQQLQQSVGVGVVCKTVYAALSLRLSDTENQELEQGELSEVWKSSTVVVVDECSMITSEVLKYLLESSKGKRLIFLGDVAQLAPVGEEEAGSPVFAQGFPTFSLTEVRRHSGVILNYCQQARGEQFSPTGYFKQHKEFPINAEFRAKTLRQPEVLEAFIQGKAKYLAWKNKNVDSLNKLVRELHFGDNIDEVQEGDQLILTAPLHGWKQELPTTSPVESAEFFTKRLAQSMASTDSLCAVEGVETAELWGIPVWKVKLQLVGGSNVVTYIVKQKGKGKYKQLLITLKSRAKQGAPNGWTIFYDVKRVFTPLKFAYGLTIHRSQGSTFNTVYVDISDILSTRDTVSGLKGAYVAMSRASESLHLVRGA